MIEEREHFSLGPPFEFMRNLWRLNHALERLSRRMETAWGVTAQQRMIIRCVGKYPGMTASQLARQFYVDAGTVSTALARLERKGLLVRRRGDRDRRRRTLGLTAAGRTVDQVAGTLEHAVESLLRAAGGEEVACTRSVLERLANLLDVEGCGDSSRSGSLNPRLPAEQDGEHCEPRAAARRAKASS